MPSAALCSSPPLRTTTALIIPPPAPATVTTNLHPLLSPESLASLIENSKSIKHLRLIHASLIRHRLDRHPVLSFKLQRCYSSLGRVDYSVTLFHKTNNPDVFSYSAIIHGHAVNNLHQQAMGFYAQMLTNRVEPNVFTFSALLKSCPITSGKAIHSQALKLGLDSDTYVRTSLVDVYAKSGELASARHLFDTMPEKSLVSLTAMITCYAKHGDVDEARSLFDGLREKDAVCWNVMIDGYTQNGKPNEALVMFRQMLKTRAKPNEVTLVAVLSACGQIGALELGRWVHSYIENNRIRFSARLGTALVDMYSKCGSLEDARMVFELIEDKDVVAWNSMINGYSIHGFTKDALTLFDTMRQKGLRPTDITFIAVLSACAHSGLVSDGWRFFTLMNHEYGIEPKIEHYGCMVNLLGRAGHLDEAYKLIQTMKIDPDPVLWGTLLGACRLHGNIELGESIAKFLVRQNLANSGTYVLLSNMYAAAGNWEGVTTVRTLMKSSGVLKEPGCTSIELNNKVHEFLAGDVKHPRSKAIYKKLEEINSWLKSLGYTPQTDIVLHDMGDLEKQRSLEVHSEKLAIAFGLISTEPGGAIRIVKNLRVCPDCHTVTKLISKITGRKIVVRDRNRFHHFENGECSCGDYW